MKRPKPEPYEIHHVESLLFFADWGAEIQFLLCTMYKYTSKCALNGRMDVLSTCTLLDGGFHRTRPMNTQNKNNSIKSILFFSLEVKLITIRPWPCHNV